MSVETKQYRTYGPSVEKDFPAFIANAISRISNGYGNSDERGIKTFLYQEVDTNFIWSLGEGERFVVFNEKEKVADHRVVFSSAVGSADIVYSVHGVSYNIGAEFKLPEDAWLIYITYYKQFLMKLYQVVPAEIVQKFDYSQARTLPDRSAESLLHDHKIIMDVLEDFGPDDGNDQTFYYGEDAALSEYSTSDIQEDYDIMLKDFGPGDKTVQEYANELESRKIKRTPRQLPAPVKNPPRQPEKGKKQVYSPDGGVSAFIDEVIVINTMTDVEFKCNLILGGRKWINLCGLEVKAHMGAGSRYFYKHGEKQGLSEDGNWKISDVWLEKILEVM